MFKPRYTLTTVLLKNINEIERLYGQLEVLHIPHQLLLNLERDNLVKSSYASNKIEGNPLTHAEVTNLLLDDRLPVNRDEKEVTNYFNILKTLGNYTKRDIDTSLILTIHNELLNGVKDNIKGKIRNEDVGVGSYDELGKLNIKHLPPFHNSKEIEENLKELNEWINRTEDIPLIKIGIYHHQFVYIHPFEDGNGRVCRLITALIFLKNNYLINKYFVLDDYYDIDKNEYSDKLHSADSGDKTEWLEYFTEGVKYSLQSSLSKVQSGLNKISFNFRPTTKEKEALDIAQRYKELTSSNLVDELGITRQQAFNLLKSLTEKGYLEKFGSTKNSYYILK